MWIGRERMEKCMGRLWDMKSERKLGRHDRFGIGRGRGEKCG